MTEIKLKPCPFCGNEFPTITRRYHTWHVACPQCETEFCRDCTAGANKSREKTIAAWNRRAEARDEYV